MWCVSRDIGGEGSGGNEKTDRIWSVRLLDALPLEEKADRLDVLALSFAEGGHELLELGRPLDLEENLVIVVGDFYVQMFTTRRCLVAFPRGASGLVLSRHFICQPY